MANKLRNPKPTLGAGAVTTIIPKYSLWFPNFFDGTMSRFPSSTLLPFLCCGPLVKAKNLETR